MRYWIAECKYDNKDKFYFYSGYFIADDIHEIALEEAERIVQQEWQKISPNPPPKLIAIHKRHVVDMGGDLLPAKGINLKD